jgi:hypothetical protein
MDPSSVADPGCQKGVKKAPDPGTQLLTFMREREM